MTKRIETHPSTPDLSSRRLEQISPSTTLSILEPGLDLIPRGRNEWDETTEYPDIGANVRHTGFLQNKNRPGEIPGSGDYCINFTLHNKGSHILEIDAGADNFPPVDLTWWTGYVTDSSRLSVFQTWMTRQFPDLAFKSIFHPDIISSAILSRAYQSPTVLSLLTDLDSTIAQTLVQDKTTRILTSHSLWPYQDRRDNTSNDKIRGLTLPFAVTRDAVDIIQLEIFRRVAEQRASMLSGLDSVISPLVEMTGHDSGMILGWLFNGVPGQTISILARTPSSDEPSCRYLASRFMASADFVAHVDFDPFSTQNRNLQFPNSNWAADQYIIEQIKAGIAPIKLLSQLIAKTQSSYLSYPTDAYTYWTTEHIRTLNGRYGLTTLPVFSTDPTSMKLILASDYVYFDKNRSNVPFFRSAPIIDLAQEVLQRSNPFPTANREDDALLNITEISF